MLFKNMIFLIYLLVILLITLLVVWNYFIHIYNIMKNVKSLYLSGNQIEDVTALAKMEQLDYLNLANNKITNVAPLSALKNVTYLTLAGNQIEDIKPLYSLPLKDLVLTRNKVKDLSGIEQMKQLEE